MTSSNINPFFPSNSIDLLKDDDFKNFYDDFIKEDNVSSQELKDPLIIFKEKELILYKNNNNRKNKIVNNENNELEEPSSKTIKGYKGP